MIKFIFIFFVIILLWHLFIFLYHLHFLFDHFILIYIDTNFLCYSSFVSQSIFTAILYVIPFIKEFLIHFVCFFLHFSILGYGFE
jgi:hypothetical protein